MSLYDMAVGVEKIGRQEFERLLSTGRLQATLQPEILRVHKEN
jgi:hypothetical protein